MNCFNLKITTLSLLAFASLYCNSQDSSFIKYRSDTNTFGNYLDLERDGNTFFYIDGDNKIKGEYSTIEKKIFFVPDSLYSFENIEIDYQEINVGFPEPTLSIEINPQLKKILKEKYSNIEFYFIGFTYSDTLKNPAYQISLESSITNYVFNKDDPPIIAFKIIGVKRFCNNNEDIYSCRTGYSTFETRVYEVLYARGLGSIKVVLDLNSLLNYNISFKREILAGKFSNNYNQILIGDKTFTKVVR